MSDQMQSYAVYFQDYLGMQVVPLFGPSFGPAGGICRCKEGADCASPGKHPKAKYKGQPSRLPTKYENYAVVLGSYVVVDVDDREILDRLSDVLGFELPETWAVDTGKGRHYWFKHHEPLATRLGAFSKVDLKSGNTYVVGPGRTSVNGITYEPINTLAIAPAPDALVTACGKQREHASTVIQHVVPATTSHFAIPAVELMCDEMRMSTTRNNTLLRLTCLLLRSGWAGEDAVAMMADAARDAGLSENEIARTQDSARKMVTLP
jgi:hypothetical protein